MQMPLARELDVARKLDRRAFGFGEAEQRLEAGLLHAFAEVGPAGVVEQHDQGDQISADAPTDVNVAVEAGTAYRRLADALYNGRGKQNLGDKAGSKIASDKARAMLELALKQAPSNRDANLEMGRFETNLGTQRNPTSTHRIVADGDGFNPSPRHR